MPPTAATTASSAIGSIPRPARSRLSVSPRKASIFRATSPSTPSGKWLYVANQEGDTIVQFEINPETGELNPTGQVTPSITPVAIVFRTPG